MKQYLAVLVSSLGFIRAMTIDEDQLSSGVAMHIQRHPVDHSMGVSIPATNAQVHIRTKFTCQSIVHIEDASAQAIAAIRTACDSGDVADVGRFSSVYMMVEQYFERHPAGELTRVLEAIRTAHERTRDLEDENAKLAENARLWRDSAYRILSDRQTIGDLKSFIETQKGTIRLVDDENQAKAARIAELEAIVTECDPAIIARREKMHDVSMKYYALLDKLDGAPSDELVAIKNHLDELSAPFIENQAFVALLERKRLIAESKPRGPHMLVGEALWLQAQERIAELEADLDEMSQDMVDGSKEMGREKAHRRRLEADNARLTEQFATLTARLDEEGIELH